MRARAVAACAPLVAAVLVWAAVGRPAQRERDLGRAEFARAREERERLREQVMSLERRSSGARTPPTGAAATRALRTALLEAANELDVGGIELGTSTGQGRISARGRLSAVGRTAAVVGLAERLAAAGSGLVLERVDLAAAAGEDAATRIDLEVRSERPRP